MRRANPRIGVGAVVAEPGRGLLLVCREHAPQAGTWAVPGGRLELGETLRQAVEREVLEETGLVVVAQQLLYVAELVGPETHFVVLDFTARLVQSSNAMVAGSDATAVSWVSPDDVAGLDLASGMSDFFKDPQVLAFLGWDPMR